MPPLLLEILKNTLAFALLLAIGYAAIHKLRRRGGPGASLARRRFLPLLWLTLLLATFKVSEAALGESYAKADRAAFAWMRARTPAVVLPAAGAITVSGSAVTLLPVFSVALGLLAWKRRKAEALLLFAAFATGAGFAGGIKLLTDRARPERWADERYWGGSFPSGHTLNTACLATALYICLTRLRPDAGRLALVLAALWVALVGASRIVLGAHWPSDVIASVGIGVLVPFATQFLLEHQRPR